MSSHAQLVRFAELNGRRVAWAAVGEGPPMVMGGWWMSHLELDWRNRRFRDFITALARYRTVVRYDRPGTGLSDRDGPPPMTLDDEVEVLAGVVDAVDAESVVVFAGSAGGPIAARYAAEHPRQVERLVLYGSYLNGARIADPAAREMMSNLIRRHWGLGSRVLADVLIPGATAAERDEFVAFQRDSARPTSRRGRSRRRTPTTSRTARPRSDHQPRCCTEGTTERSRSSSVVSSPPVSQAQRSSPSKAPITSPGTETQQPWRERRSNSQASTGPEVEIAPPTDVPRAATDTDLSARELEVLRLVAEGLSDAEIAERLVLSQHTVHRHVANIRTKLRLPSRAAAVAVATRLGLL